MAPRARTSPRKPWLMKRYKSRGTVDTSKVPRWWLSRPDQVEDYCRSLPGVKTFELGRSAGGRSILAIAWGPREDLPERTCLRLGSAVEGGAPEAFYGKGRRARQSFMILGGAHGTEIEGSVAAVNLLSVVVTGKDLRGKRWPRMREAGRKLRLVIVPFFNVDGRERHHDRLGFVGADPEEMRSMSQGNWKSGEKLSWPTSKLHHPIPLDQVENLGTYFNDHGVNLVYDYDFAGDCQPETKGLVRFLRHEMPDGVLCSHSDNGSLVQPPSAFVPAHYRQRQLQVGAIVAARCQREGAKKQGLLNRVETYAEQAFYQTDMIYHCCGAFPLLVEFPCGYQNFPDNYGELLDIGMYILEEVVVFGTVYGFRPRDPQRK